MDDNLQDNKPVKHEDSGASIIINLESSIKSHLSAIDLLEDDLDKHSSMLKAIFENDPTYKEHCDIVKEASKVRNNTKQQILKQPQAADLANKVKSQKIRTI